MKAGLVGLPGSGKTTLFNALTALHRGADAHVHLGAIKVPDPRVEMLASLYKPKRVVPAEIVFVDVPGARGRDLGGDSAKALGDVDALCLVVRGFVAADGAPPEPLADLRAFDADLAAADLLVVERRLDRLRKEHGGRTGGEYHELERIRAHLAAGRPLRTLAWTDAEAAQMAGFGFLSRKPMLVVLNVAEADAGQPVPAELAAEQAAHGTEALALCAPFEGEIAELDPAEQPAFLESLGLTEPVRDRFIHATYHLLGLVTFFKVSDEEVRAFTVRRGDKAPRAVGRIDPAAERGFTRVDVAHCSEITGRGDWKTHARPEGKDYVVRDGDILQVRPA